MSFDRVAQVATLPTAQGPSFLSLRSPSGVADAQQFEARPDVSHASPEDTRPSDHMATTGYLLSASSLQTDSQPRSTLPHIMSGPRLDDDASSKPIGTPSSPTHVLMRRLPTNISEERLQVMLIWSKTLTSVKLLPVDQSDDDGFRSALLTFTSQAGAVEAKNMLNGRADPTYGASTMSLEILPSQNGRQANTSDSPPGERISATSSTSSSASGSRQPSRINGRLHSMDGIAPNLGQSFPPQDLSHSNGASAFPSLYSRQPPIGSQRTERSGSSGKALINGDSAADDETNDIMWNPLRFTENGTFAESRSNSQRRATAPQLPLAALNALSLDTSTPTMPPTLPPYSGSTSAHPSLISPLGAVPSPHPYSAVGSQQFSRGFPPVNPADQNPPCNTLYVGNLPLDTSEEELKATFSKQRGYKRLCFRTKANGPMCFVEFEDISFATKALSDLYGHMLHNSTKGGIRLSFSKNPLGVRSGHNHHHSNSPQMGGMHHMMPASTFTTANGPPPGLSAPPGLRAQHNAGGQAQNLNHPYAQNQTTAHRQGHGGYQSYANNGQNGAGWNRPPGNDAHQGAFAAPGFVPAHMMGR